MVLEMLRRLVSGGADSSPESSASTTGDTSGRGPGGDLDDALTSKPAEFIALLEEHGGRMKQAEMVAKTEWSSATVSRVLSEMEANGVIRKISIGRENVVTLVGAEPAWYTPPEPAADPAGSPTEEVPDGSDRAILMVEDNPADARLLQEAFKEANIPNPIHVVHDGSDALEFLLQQGPYTDAPRPGLVLLDLSLLMVDGLDVLRELNERQTLRGIPLLVLSHSADPDDVHSAYEHGATAYLTKPEEYGALVDLAHTIDDFWLSTVVPPKQPAPVRA